jgi:hypothetical protein
LGLPSACKLCVIIAFPNGPGLAIHSVAASSSGGMEMPKSWGRVLLVVMCFGVVANSSGQPPDNVKQTRLRGCLNRGSGEFILATDYQHAYRLTGDTSALSELLDPWTKEVSLLGIEDHSTDPQPTFKVIKLVRVFERPKPQLSPAFGDSSKWVTERNPEYGVQFEHPDSMSIVPATEAGTERSNFVAKDGAIALGSFWIPREIYPGSNFSGGGFSLSVNPEIANMESCNVFGYSDPKHFSSETLGGIRYAEMPGFDAASNTNYETHYFHTFQNGRCYEIAIEVAYFNTGVIDDGGCTIPEIQEADKMRLIDPLVASVSFFRPATGGAAVEPKSDREPKVTSFSASSETADDVMNRGLITFSWTTEEADYVEFTYTCPNPSDVDRRGISSMVIAEDFSIRYCKNTDSFKTYSTNNFYHSPNSSAQMGFGYFDHEDPTSVVVTITPFSHGAAYADSSKSLTVTVNPYNPFQRGIPRETRNMTLAYAPGANGAQDYQQGSPMTIMWTDSRAQDPCVNLYLVRDNDLMRDNGAGGETYLLQINGTLEIGCLKPASKGVYTWTVTSKYLGTSFRVLARTPGGTSGTLGTRFNIVRAQSDGQRE